MGGYSNYDLGYGSGDASGPAAPQPNAIQRYLMFLKNGIKAPGDPTQQQQGGQSSSGGPGSNPIRNYISNNVIGHGDLGGTPGTNGQPGTDQGGPSGIIGLLGLRRGGLIRRGGLVTRPTVTNLGKDGPTAVIPLKQPVDAQRQQLAKYQGIAREKDSPLPESPASLKIQVDQLTAGQRKTVLFPEGSNIPPRPAGIQQMRTQDGVVFYDPQAINAQQIREASNSGDLGVILGDKDAGYGAPPKSQLRGKVDVVSPEGPDGTPVQDVATDGDHLDQTKSAASRLIPRGGRLRVQSPQAAIMNRVRSATQEPEQPDDPRYGGLTPMATGGYIDDDEIDQEPTETESAPAPQPNPQAPGTIPPSNDPTDEDVLNRARQLAMGNKEADQRYEALRTAAQAPLQKPSVGRTIAGAAVQLLGRGRLDNVAQNIMYPGLAEHARAQQAFEDERQRRQEEANEVGKLGTYARLKGMADARVAARSSAQSGEQDRFIKGGGVFSPTSSMGGSATFAAPPQAAIQEGAAALPSSAMTQPVPQVTAPGQPLPTTNGLPPGAQGPPAPPPQRQFIQPAQQPVPQIAPPDLGPQSVTPPPAMPVTIAAKGPIAPPAGAQQVPNAPYDKPGFQRYQRDPAQVAAQQAKDKAAAKTADYKALPKEIADSYGIAPDETFPMTAYTQLATEYKRTQAAADKDKGLQFERSTDDTTGDVTTVGYDKSTGQEVSRSVIRGIAKKRPTVLQMQGASEPIKDNSPEFKVAQDLAYGKLTMPQFRGLYSYSRDVNKKLAIYEKATELNPNFNPAQFEMGFTLAKNPKVQQQLASLDNVTKGVPDLLKFSDAATRSGVTILNKLIVPGGVALGGKKYSNLQTARTAFADELSGALGYGSATDMSREMGFNMTDPNLSAENFRSAIQDVVIPFVDRKRGTLLNQMGVYGQPGMNPAANGTAPTQPQPQGAVPRISNAAEYNALKPGPYIDPNGIQRVKR